MKKSAPPTFELYPADGAGERQLLQLVAPGHVRSSSCGALNQTELTDDNKSQVGVYKKRPKPKSTVKILPQTESLLP